MKRLILSLVLLSISFVTSAQSLTSSTPSVDISKSHPIASPNRVTAAALAHSTKAAKKHWHHPHHWQHVVAPAISWVDSNGKTVGRLVDRASVLVPYNGESAVISGLSVNDDCTPGGTPCRGMGGSSVWKPTFMTFYTTQDCSGTVYLSLAKAGTPYAGIPVLEDDILYIFIVRAADLSRITVRSLAIGTSCSVYTEPSSVYAALAFAVEPVTNFGTPPFALK